MSSFAIHPVMVQVMSSCQVPWAILSFYPTCALSPSGLPVCEENSRLYGRLDSGRTWDLSKEIAEVKEMVIVRLNSS